MLKVINDFKKEYPLSSLSEQSTLISQEGIHWGKISSELKILYDHLEQCGGRKIVHQVQNLSQRAGQLHEKINYLKVQEQFNELQDDWEKRKAFVDRLFDQGLITFTADRHVILSDCLSSYTWKRIGLKNHMFIKGLPMDEKRIVYLKFHQRSVFKGSLED